MRAALEFRQLRAPLHLAQPFRTRLHLAALALIALALAPRRRLLPLFTPAEPLLFAPGRFSNSASSPPS
jgi:hypothetical protein